MFTAQPSKFQSISLSYSVFEFRTAHYSRSQHDRMRTHNAGVVSSIPPCVTIKTPLARKAMGSNSIKSTSPERNQSPVSGFCYARNRVCDEVQC